MNPFPLWPAPIILALIIAISWGGVAAIPALRREVANDKMQPAFYPQLEGLRGLLAVAVFLHHAVVRFLVLPQIGEWQSPPSILYSQLADAPVLMFFFLTGFLFWSKLLRRPHLRLADHLIGRVRRLFPVYSVAMIWFFLLVACKTGFSIQTSFLQVSTSGLKWLLFTLPGATDINGLTDTWHLIAGTPWTLAYEWKFYFLLPFLVWFARKPHRCAYLLGLFGALFLLFSILTSRQQLGSLAHSVDLMRLFAGHLFFSFGVGILVATLRFRWNVDPKFARSSLISIASVVCLVWATCFHEPGFFDPLMSLLLGSAFIAIVYGNTFWGLLTWEPVLLLGKCSYSLYLCHGLTLATFVLLLTRYLSLESVPVAASWVFIGLSGFLVVVVSLLCYTFVESKFLRARVSPPLHKVPEGAHRRPDLEAYGLRSKA